MFCPISLRNLFDIGERDTDRNFTIASIFLGGRMTSVPIAATWLRLWFDLYSNTFANYEKLKAG